MAVVMGGGGECMRSDKYIPSSCRKQNGGGAVDFDPPTRRKCFNLQGRPQWRRVCI